MNWLFIGSLAALGLALSGLRLRTVPVRGIPTRSRKVWSVIAAASAFAVTGQIITQIAENRDLLTAQLSRPGESVVIALAGGLAITLVIAYVLRLEHSDIQRFTVLFVALLAAASVGATLAGPLVNARAFAPNTPEPPESVMLLSGGASELRLMTLVDQFSYLQPRTPLDRFTESPGYFNVQGTTTLRAFITGTPNTSVEFLYLVESKSKYKLEVGAQRLSTSPLTEQFANGFDWGHEQASGECLPDTSLGDALILSTDVEDYEYAHGSVRLDSDGLAEVDAVAGKVASYSGTVQTLTVVKPPRLRTLVATDEGWCLSGRGDLIGAWTPTQKTTLEVVDPLATFYGTGIDYGITRSDPETYSDGMWARSFDAPITVPDNDAQPWAALPGLWPRAQVEDPGFLATTSASALFAAILLGVALTCLIELAVRYPRRPSRGGLVHAQSPVPGSAAIPSTPRRRSLSSRTRNRRIKPPTR